MKIEVCDHHKALNGDDAKAKAVAKLHYGIGYLQDALTDYENLLESVQSDDDSNSDVIEKRAKSSMITAKRFISDYHNRNKEVS